MELVVAIPVIPLIAFAILLVGRGRLPGNGPAYVGIAAAGASLALAVVVLVKVVNGFHLDETFTWFTVADFALRGGLMMDSLSALMAVVVTLVGLCVQVYSIGYMHGEARFGWYYTVVNLFTAAMLFVITANNFVQFLIAWEIMGLCSYLLIGFWYHKSEAASAAKKAFLTTRIGDVGMLLGIALLITATGTAHFGGVFAALPGLGQAFATTVALLLFMGAVGKSAQFPLHVWLPDAMAGPTPASALIHAATMVAAGVYLVARSYPIFEHAPAALTAVASVGAVTAFMGAVIAVFQNDIKKILAYSTISQLGYMMIGLGVGGYVAGVFHLMTHAFFKALLFLGAGSVIHALHTQDIRAMGGLHRKMKVTTWTFMIGACALAGIPPFSGFWSKDEILTHALESGNYAVFALGIVTAFITAFYVGKLCFTAFFGEPKSRERFHRAHESPAVMTGSLVTLAVPAAVAGAVGSPLTHHALTTFLEGSDAAVEVNPAVMALSASVAFLGLALAYGVFYRRSFGVPGVLRPPLVAGAARLSAGNRYGRECASAGCTRLAGLAATVDQKVIDGAVNGVGSAVVTMAYLSRGVDTRAVDALVNGIGALVTGAGARLRRIQTGYVQNYALVIFIVVLLLIVLRSAEV